jgi:hypothetical protein
MKLLVTTLVIVVIAYGVYHVTVAAYGWFQMSNAVDEVASREAPAVAASQGGLVFGDRYGRVREEIVSRAREAGVPLARENVAVGVTNGVLDVRLSWDAPIVVYNGTPYVEIPMTLQRGYALDRIAPR